LRRERGFIYEPIGELDISLHSGAGTFYIGQSTKQQTTPPDNTNVNKRDQDQSRPTAGQQKENRPDREITRLIRQSITQDKVLSTYAKNVKVITQNGNVMLRGPVRSQEEKATIETKANEIAGASHVKSEIQLAPPKEPNKKTHNNREKVRALHGEGASIRVIAAQLGLTKSTVHSIVAA